MRNIVQQFKDFIMIKPIAFSFHSESQTSKKPTQTCEFKLQLQLKLGEAQYKMSKSWCRRSITIWFYII